MRFVGRTFASTLAVIITAYILPGVQVEDFITAIIVALVIAFLNGFVKPFLIVLTIPVTFLTLGLFLLVINAAMINLAAYAVDGFYVEGFWWALLFAIIMSILNSMFNGLNTSEEKEERY